MPQYRKILIVEDETIVGEYLRLCVNRLGHDVTAVVATGVDAIAEVERNTPDIIFMDIRLRGELDGVATAAVIQQRHDIPLVYLTAYSDGATLERAKLTSPAGYVHKPFREADLRSAIEIALYKHDTDRKLKENERRLSTILRGIGDGV
ncbi:MAG TPA: response regulator, partial [Verrucomicrobiae bacterium]|nr:response regulator [Verrucomicrobiae bacterium]